MVIKVAISAAGSSDLLATKEQRQGLAPGHSGKIEEVAFLVSQRTASVAGQNMRVGRRATRGT